MKKIKLSWDQFQKAVDELATKLKPVTPFAKNIYGVPRGGLVLAVALSHQLNLPLIFDTKRITRGTIIVDDISDSGETLLKLTEKREYLRTATIYKTLKTKFEPTYSAYIKGDDQFIVFPYETFNSAKYDRTKI